MIRRRVSELADTAVQEIKLEVGMILYHQKTCEYYIIEELEAFYSEMPDPLEAPMVGYRALYGAKLKWFRDKHMFTHDRFQVVKDILLHTPDDTVFQY
jgi:hypothetical protein